MDHVRELPVRKSSNTSTSQCLRLHRVPCRATKERCRHSGGGKRQQLKRKPIELAPASTREEVRMLYRAGLSLDEYRAYKTHFDKEVA